MAGLRKTGSLLVIALMPCVLTGCASTSSRLANLFKTPAESQEQSLARAQSLEREGHYPEARQLYAELSQRNPRSAQYAHRLGVTCTMLGEHQEAQQAYNRAKKLDPNNAELLADMGYAAYLQQNYVEAETLLRASLAKANNNPRVKSHLALAVGCQGRYGESLSMFRELHGKNEASILYNLAYVKTRHGDLADAALLYQQVLSIDPSYKKASIALAQLKGGAATEQAIAETQRQQQPVQTDNIAAAPADSVWSPTAENAVATAHAEGAQTNWAIEEASATETQQAAHQPGELSPAEDADEVFWTESETDLKAIPSEGASRQFPNEAQAAEPNTALAPSSISEEMQTVETDDAPFTVVIDPAEEAAAAAIESEPKSASNEPRELVESWSPVDTNPLEQFGPEWLKSRRDQVAARAGQTGFMGFCPVALRDELELADAMPQYTAEYQSQTFQFSSEAALQKFQAKPERYVPAAGGLDVVAVSQGTAVAQGSLEHALWFRHKLYLFMNRENMELFRTQAREFAVQE